jgi:hypothetical protein
MSGNKSKHKKQKNSNKRNGNRFRGPFIGGGLLIALLLLYLTAALYYKSHFYGSTMINGIDTANMTVSEAEKAISTEVDSYQLSLTGRNNLTDTILGSNINLHTVFNGCVTNLLQKQNPMAWPVYLFQAKEYSVETMLNYDESLLKLCFDRLNCFDEANNVEPENASISEYGESGYTIVPENQGSKVIKDKLYTVVCDAINVLQTSLSIEDADCYAKPVIGPDYPALVQALDQLNKIAGTQITYQFGDVAEVMDGSKISKWLSIDDNYNVSFDESGVKDFVDYIGKTYNTFGKTRTFQTSYDDIIKVSGGDYGWWLNRPEEVKALTQLIKDGEKLVREPVYFQTAQQYGSDDIGGTYVEINLSAQHLFFYKDNELILESDFVSGNVSKNLATPVGTYPVQYKENDATLVGEDYETPVKYWMPFNRNIGMHDANWRDKFGADIYLTNGSHGCINMPPANAKKMFKYMQRGVAVVVYELPGTESYEMTDKDQAILDKAKADKENPDKTDTDKTDTKKTDTQKPDVDKTGTDKTGTDKTGTDKAGTDNTNTDDTVQ